MSAQRLSMRSCRRIARAIGEDVLRGWSHGGYTLGFVTPDHRHGWFDKKTGEWGFHESQLDEHYSPSCEETWPEDVHRDRAEKLTKLAAWRAAHSR